MSKPAARMGDPTAHGTPLSPGPGCVTVLIGGKPAWRMGDFHACPLTTGPVPHVGGTGPMGSFKVLIGCQPASCMGDQIIEVGPPNSIVMGQPTVLIG